MEISVRPLKQDPVDYYYYHKDYKVVVDDHQILTLETDCCRTCSKWLLDAIKTRNTRSDGFVAGVAVDRQFPRYHKGGVADDPYEIIQICIGSHCLIFHLPYPEKSLFPVNYDPSFLQSFFADSRVTVVGMNMKAVAKKLEKDFGIKMRKALDLNELAVKGMRRDDLDLGKYDLDRLGKTVLGKRWDVVREDRPVEWYEKRPRGYWPWTPIYDDTLSVTKIKFATVDPYLCFVIGTKLLEMFRNPASASQMAIPKNKTEKKKKKNNNNSKNKYY